MIQISFELLILVPMLFFSFGALFIGRLYSKSIDNANQKIIDQYQQILDLKADIEARKKINEFEFETYCDKLKQQFSTLKAKKND